MVLLWTIRLLRALLVPSRGLARRGKVSPMPSHTITRPSALESSLERLLFARVRAIGGIAIKMAPLVKGTPDRLVLLPMGRTYLVELKTTTGTLSPAQKIWHERAAAIGCEVVTLRGADEICRWINGVANEQSTPSDIGDPLTKAKALREHASRVRRMRGGMLVKATVVGDLLDYAERYERGEEA